MKCAECKCVDESAAGWVATLGVDPDDERAPHEVIAFCPVCAAREFRIARKTAETYT
jgi:hypothetical protein